MALQAGANGLPFIPVIGLLNSDYMKVNRDFVTMKDPFGGKEYVVVPPIVPDVAVIHAFKGDVFGNVITDSFRNDRLLAMAARKTIAVVEELVEPDAVLPGKHGVFVSMVHINAVVVAPGGAHPTACRDAYDIDAAHIMTYMESTKDEKSFLKYLETYITGPKDHTQYLKLVESEVNND